MSNGRLKKAASGVLANFECSRTGSTIRAQHCLRPCWTTFLNRPKVFPFQYISGFIRL